MHARRGRTRPTAGTWAGRVGGLMAIILFVAPALGSAAADPFPGSGAFPGSGGPELAGKIAPNGDLVVIYTTGLTSTPVSDGDTLYVDSIQVAVYHPGYNGSAAGIQVRQFVPGSAQEQVSEPGPNGSRINLTVTVPTYEDSHWMNSSMALAGRSITSGTIALPSAPDGRHAWIEVDGVSWNVTHHTLPSALPYALLTNGAADLLVLLVIAEALLCMGAGIAIARWLQRRGQGWAPKFKWGIWGGGSSVVTILAVLLYYPQIDLLLGGLSFLAYAPLATPLTALWGLSLFNRGDVTTFWRPDISSDANRFGTNVWEPRLTSSADGRLIYVEESWAGWVKGAFFGKVTYVYARLPKAKADVVEGPPVFLPIRVPTKSGLPFGSYRVRFRRLRWSRPQPPPRKGRRLSGPHWESIEARFRELPDELHRLVPLSGERLFKITNAGTSPNLPKAIGWIDHDGRYQVEHPHLVAHRLEPIRGSDGLPVRDPETGEIQSRRKLAWPHFHPPEGRATIDASGIHWIHQVRVLQGVKTIGDVTRALEARTMQVHALKAEVIRRHEEDAEKIADALTRLEGRERGLASDEQIQEEIDAWGRRDRGSDDKDQRHEASGKKEDKRDGKRRRR